MNTSIEKLSKLINDLINIVDKFLPAQIQQKYFDTWTIRKMLAHISGWNLHTINCLNNLKNNEFSQWGAETNEFNNQSILERQNKNWQEIYQEFIATSQKLVDEYKSLNKNQFIQEIYSDHQYTPEKSLKTDIDHYQEHLTSMLRITNSILFAAGMFAGSKPTIPVDIDNIRDYIDYSRD